MDSYSRGNPSAPWFRRVHWGRGVALFLAALYFIVPFYAAMQFCLQNINGQFSLETFSQVAQAPGFYSALWLSTQLAIVTMAIVLMLMVPTMI